MLYEVKMRMPSGDVFRTRVEACSAADAYAKLARVNAINVTSGDAFACFVNVGLVESFDISEVDG